MICEYCNNPIPQHEIDYALHLQQDGFFCELCEYYHYFNQDKQRPKYKLFLERSSNQNDIRILNKPKVKLSKRLSPLRYPGGKSRLIDFMYHEVIQSNKKTLYSPFAGGASVELALLEANIVDHIVLNDLDKHLINFYNIAFYSTAQLINQIENNSLTIKLYERAHRAVNSDFNDLANIPKEKLAFYYLINNRCSFSGIYNAGRMGGKNGTLKALSSRWNPKNMISRLEKLNQMSNSVTITNQPYQAYIEKFAWDENGLFIIDPPYIEKAQDLYRHAFDLDEHQTLFTYLSSFWHSHPASDFFIFYDEHPHLYKLPIPDDIEILARKFSIANK